MNDTILALLIIFVIAPVVIASIILSIVIPIKVRNARYINLVLSHSEAIHKLREINNRFSFVKIKDCDLHHTYDSEDMFNEISCTDYLIYELVYNYRPIIENLNNTLYNKEQYIIYANDIKSIKCDGSCDVDISKYNFRKIINTERQEFEYMKLRPTVAFKLNVTLFYRNMADRLIDHKTKTYYPDDINALFRETRKKRGTFFLNENVWSAICRVERGKVTNKMRFAIYARDGYRCKMCGRYTDDLEIDHIIPISKGGKSTMSNLQTLCHRCNQKKGSDIL